MCTVSVTLIDLVFFSIICRHSFSQFFSFVYLAWHLDTGCQYGNGPVLHPFAFRVHAHTLGNRICTVKPHLTDTQLIRPPRCYGHLILTRKNQSSYLKNPFDTTTPLIRRWSYQRGSTVIRS